MFYFLPLFNASSSPYNDIILNVIIIMIGIVKCIHLFIYLAYRPIDFNSIYDMYNQYIQKFELRYNIL